MEEDSLLSLDTDVLGPLDESGQISGWLDVTTDAEVLGGLLEEGRLGVLSLAGANHDFLALCSFLNLILNHSQHVFIRVNKSLPSLRAEDWVELECH